MALSKIDVANMLTGVTPVANGGTALSSGFSNGITMCNQWRITGDFADDADPITNWELADTDGYGGLGSNMTLSSGVFTFPSTGIYHLQFYVTGIADNIDGLANIIISTTTDGTNFGTASSKRIGWSRASDANSFASSFIFDVTNTSTHKARFAVTEISSDTTIRGSSAHNETSATFIRLGDT